MRMHSNSGNSTTTSTSNDAACTPASEHKKNIKNGNKNATVTPDCGPMVPVSSSSASSSSLPPRLSPPSHHHLHGGKEQQQQTKKKRLIGGDAGYNNDANVVNDGCSTSTPARGGKRARVSPIKQPRNNSMSSPPKSCSILNPSNSSITSTPSVPPSSLTTTPSNSAPGIGTPGT
eukprot:CAMPEP_0195529940 /NCGR_PEP_ID=MMETSP0794_2-20130614/32609_1 /TAXON_ID=515487 /ORGANISM="Stephanopyxis turris, Strain CCMP 815" /LENGTH=174 /DNA_ID=CAMNT_0040661323 /DNA_START=81 /DNA_END=601 /DNA_ORIENTATION=+